MAVVFFEENYMVSKKGKIHIFSYSETSFSSRGEAGRLLAAELKQFAGENTVLLGIPRGGIIVAEEVARLLKAELDVVLSRKLGAPANPELAIGALSEDGHIFLNKALVFSLRVDENYIALEKERQLQEIKRRIQAYRSVRPKVSLTGKTVIITDDGIATGATMEAALWIAKQEKPKYLVAAAPVAPADSLEKLTLTADEVLCLRVPEWFGAVGQFYREFTQVDDEEVVEILKKGSSK